jgi:hypothetical protein
MREIRNLIVQIADKREERLIFKYFQNLLGRKMGWVSALSEGVGAEEAGVRQDYIHQFMR